MMEVEMSKITWVLRVEILAKVKEREYQKRCVNAGICPMCGATLKKKYHEGVDLVCVPCNVVWKELG